VYAGLDRLAGRPPLSAHRIAIRRAIDDTDLVLRHCSMPWIVMAGATLVAILGVLGRVAARSTVPDPVARLAAWVAAWPTARRAVLAVPAALCLAQLTRWTAHYYDPSGWHSATYTLGIAAFWCACAAGAIAIYAATEAGMRALLEPIEGPALQRQEDVSRRLDFAAVAVTRETFAALGALAFLPVATSFAFLHYCRRWPGNMTVLCWLILYVVVAVTALLAFRRASRIAVGVDGVLVHGSRRFFAFRDLETARADGSDLVLMRHGKVALRLQLHGADALHRDAVAARLAAAIQIARVRANAAVGELVASVSSRQLARSAGGASDYRVPSVSRDQLWALVEGPEHDGSTRAAAARALVATGSTTERARLRVAATRCAEPRLRIELLEMADSTNAPGEGATA
jgi:hypothetical protein